MSLRDFRKRRRDGANCDGANCDGTDCDGANCDGTNWAHGNGANCASGNGTNCASGNGGDARDDEYTRDDGVESSNDEDNYWRVEKCIYKTSDSDRSLGSSGYWSSEPSDEDGDDADWHPAM
jgi:hypothetical protein